MKYFWKKKKEHYTEFERWLVHLSFSPLGRPPLHRASRKCQGSSGKCCELGSEFASGFACPGASGARHPTQLVPRKVARNTQR